MAEPEQNAGHDVESRRSPNARRLTPARRLGYALGAPLLSVCMRLLWATCRVQKVLGEDAIAAAIANGRAFVPCYWHRDIFCCLMTIRGWIQRGFRAGVIISPSVDGDVPAKIARSWGATVVRGSAKHTNAFAMRDIQKAMREGVSIVSAADGPLGPCYEFKPGVVLMARIGGAPLVPLSCAADRAWTLRRWDRFLLPKPFARVVLAVGEPLEIPEGTPVPELESYRQEIERRTEALRAETEKALERQS